MDQKACDPRCGSGKICRSGQCVTSPCPEGMVHVPTSPSKPSSFCIAGYESSKGTGGKAAWLKGVEPWTGVYPGEAFLACRAAGATLCMDQYWRDACTGASSDNKNDDSRFIADICAQRNDNKTGSVPGCEGGFTGLFDMLGNVPEWVMTAQTTEGCYGAQAIAGWGSTPSEVSCDHANTDFSWQNSSILPGFRCCLPCSASGNCSASRVWFQFLIQDTSGKGSNNGSATTIWGRSLSELWMAVDSGLAHFNGHYWKQDSNMAQFREISSITGTSTKEIYVSAKNEIRSHNGSVWSSFDNTGLTLQNIKGLYAIAKGDLYAVGDPPGSGGQSVFRYQNSQWSPVGSFTMALEAVWVHQSVVWVAGAEGVIGRYDGSSWTQFKQNSSQNFAAIHGTSNGDLWVVGHESLASLKVGIIYHYNGTDWTKQDISAPKNSSGLSSLHALPNGMLWASGERIVQRDATGKWIWHSNTLSGPVWVPDITKPDEVWVGPFRYR